MARAKQGRPIHDYHVRLFREDVEFIKAGALERGLPWQAVLRVMVRDAVKAAKAGVAIIKEHP